MRMCVKVFSLFFSADGQIQGQIQGGGGSRGKLKERRFDCFAFWAFHACCLMFHASTNKNLFYCFRNWPKMFRSDVFEYLKKKTTTTKPNGTNWRKKTHTHQPNEMAFISISFMMQRRPLSCRLHLNIKYIKAIESTSRSQCPNVSVTI